MINSRGFSLTFPTPFQTVIGILMAAVGCYSYSPDSMQFDSRLNGFNATLVVAQHQIVSIKSEMRTITNSFQFDLSNLFSQLAVMREKLDMACKLIEELQLQQQNTELAVTVAGLDAEVKELTEKINPLEESNKLWKHNFQIVNRTFAALRNSGCIKS